MSTDVFAPAAFPRLDGRADEAEQARARLRGYADGHAEGFRAGAAEAVAAQRIADDARTARDTVTAREVAAALAALRAAAHSLHDRERELTATAQEQVLRHAVDLAELILAAELTDAGSSAAAAARRALTAADPADIRALRVHPDDLHTLQQRGDLVDEPGFALIADPTLDRGDALAVLDHGHIDARVGSAVGRARHALDEAS